MFFIGCALENFILTFAALLLVLLNGFFVAAEFSLVKLRQTRAREIAHTAGFRGKILLTVHQQLDAYLSACQLGITLASLGLGWIGEPAFARLVAPVLSVIGVTSPELVHGISFVFAFLVISYLHIVVGELAPKSMAIRSAATIALWCAVPLYLFYWAMYPLIWCLNHSANWLLRVTGLDRSHGQDSAYSPEELKLILRASKSTQLGESEWKVLSQTLEFRELDVADLMRPANEMVVLSRANTLADNLDIMHRNRFSRYPYLDEEGHVTGVVHVKDLFIAEQGDKRIDDLESHLRPVQFVSPYMSAMELLRRFKMGSPHFAIIGKKGEPAEGFLTMDNLLAVLVGDIRDEFRHSEHEWARLEDGTLLGKGSLPIVSLEYMLGIDIPQDGSEEEEVDSIGGLIMSRLGDIPREGQKVEFDQFDVVVKRMNGPRIVLVKVYPKSHNEEDWSS